MLNFLHIGIQVVKFIQKCCTLVLSTSLSTIFVNIFYIFSISVSEIAEQMKMISWFHTPTYRVADVGEPREWRCMKGQGLLRKEGPPTYTILSRNLVLSRYTCVLKGHHRAFYESHPALGAFSTSVRLLSESFWRARFCRAFVGLSESFRRTDRSTYLKFRFWTSERVFEGTCLCM